MIEIEFDINKVKLICDERIGCVAVYPESIGKQNCLSGITPNCVYYASGERINGHWTVPEFRLQVARAITYRWNVAIDTLTGESDAED